MTRHSLLALGLALTTSVTRASPIVARQDTTTLTADNCTSDKEIQPQCWIDLDVPGYIKDWEAANGTAADCDSLGFAQCFLFAHGYTGLTCDDITSNTCPPFATIDPSAYSSPQEFYVLWNIYNTYQLFNSWSQSLYNGAQLAAGTLDDIVATVSPPTNNQVSHSIIASLLASSFFFLSNFMAIVPIAAPLAVGETLIAGLVVNNAATSFSMTSSLMGYFAGGGDTDVRFTTLGTIGTDLSNLVVDFQTNLVKGIKEIQGNSTMFLALADQGVLSLRLKNGDVDQSVNLFRDLQVYILSEALASNGIISAKSTNVNALTFAPTTPGTVDCPGLGPAGNCYQFWVDEEAGNTYAFHNPADWTPKVDYVDMMNKITDQGWANLTELFKIEDCQGVTPSLNTTTLSMNCLASHKLCEWNYPPGMEAYEVADQWLNCDNDEKWGYACSSWVSGIEIPPSYLGPSLLEKSSSGNWCSAT